MGNAQDRRFGKAREGGSDGETNGVMLLIVGAFSSRPLLTLTLSPLCEECNDARNGSDNLDTL